MSSRVVNAFTVLFIATLGLVACGGGGGGSSSTPVVTTTPSTGIAQFVIGAGGTVQSNMRSPKYLAPTTQSVGVAIAGVQNPDFINLVQGGPGCTGTIPNMTCTLNVTSPTGSRVFQIATFNQPNLNGLELSAAQIELNIGGGTNVVHVTLNGIVSGLNLGPIDVPEATPTTVPIPLKIVDADNNIIVGPGNYDAAVSLQDNDTSGSTSISTNSLTAPGALPTLRYNGSGQPNGIVVASKGTLTTQYSNGGLIRVVPQYTEYTLTSGRRPSGPIIPANDSSLWFSATGNVNPDLSGAIVHVTSTGTITEYPIPSQFGLGAYAMALGADGNVWFSAPVTFGSSGYIVKMDPSGNFTGYNSGIDPRGVAGLALGPDSNIWFANGTSIGKIDTSGNVTTYLYPPTVGTGVGVWFGDVVAGPDGNMWVADTEEGGLLRVTTSGQMTLFRMPAIPGTPYYVSPYAITVGSDGNFHVLGNGNVYTINTSGTVLATTAVNANPQSHLVQAPNGSMWFGTNVDVFGGAVVARLNSNGTLTTVSLPSSTSAQDITAPAITGLAAGHDGSMWYVRGVNVGKIVVH